jgi:spore germination protein KC
MKNKKISLLTLMILFQSVMATGCWNYREIERLAIVSGVAVDKGTDERYRITVEVVQFIGGKESRATSETMTLEGKTIFDAARNVIAFSGKRLYWSHAKILVISEEVAREGIEKILDWFNRDSETRADIHVLISRNVPAKDILESTSIGEEVKSLELREMVDNQEALSKAPQIEIWEFVNSLAAKGKVAIAPIIELEPINKEVVPRIMGTAIFKKDKYIGYLGAEDTKDMLFVQDKIKGGILVRVESGSHGDIPMSLEIFKSKTKIEPVVRGNNIQFNVSIYTLVAIDELGGSENFIEEPKREEFEKATEKAIEDRIMRLINSMKNDYGVDVFGFGEKLRENKYKEWKRFEGNWNEKFQDISVNVKMDLHIKNSAMLAKPLEIGE